MAPFGLVGLSFSSTCSFKFSACLDWLNCKSKKLPLREFLTLVFSGTRMFCCFARLKRCFKKEPIRDVSFIVNAKERKILTDAIRAVDSIDGWDLLRKGEVTSVTTSMDLSLHTEDSLHSTVALLSHIADNWDNWVEKRSVRQDIDEKNKRSLQMWIRSHQYTPNTNNFILFSYLENLLRFIEDWSSVDKKGAGAYDLIFAIESVIAKADPELSEEEYKVEVYKNVIKVNIPSDYELTKELMDKHVEFIKAYDDLYEAQLNQLRLAITAKDLESLQAAMRGRNIMKKLRTSPEYLIAIGLEQELLNH